MLVTTFVNVVQIILALHAKVFRALVKAAVTRSRFVQEMASVLHLTCAVANQITRAAHASNTGAMVSPLQLQPYAVVAVHASSLTHVIATQATLATVLFLYALV